VGVESVRIILAMLATRHDRLATFAEPFLADRSLVPLEPGEPDPLCQPNEDELDDAEEFGDPVWSFPASPPVAASPAGCDVFVAGLPALAFGNRAIYPRVRVSRAVPADRQDEAAVLLDCYRHRARSMTRIVGAALRDPYVAAIARELGMHESHVVDVLGVVRVQTRDGVFGVTIDDERRALMTTA
jgi:hypothetical protein